MKAEVLNGVKSKLVQLGHELNNQPSVQALKHWYGTLSRGDQRVVKAIGWLLLAALIFLLFYAPLLNERKQAQVELNRHLALYTLIAQNAGKFSSAHSANGAGQESLLGTVMQLAQKQNVILTRYEQDGQNLRIWLDRAPFDEAIGYFENLAQQGILASQISVDKTDRAGRVDIRATLAR